MSTAKLLKLAQHFEKIAQYTGQPELTQENILSTLRSLDQRVRSDISGFISAGLISAAFGKDYGSRFEVIVKMPYVERDEEAIILNQLDATFNDRGYTGEYPVVDFVLDFS